MACYLVDYENVNQKGVNGVTQLKLTENDSIVIYYSNSANSLTFELHNELMRTNAKIEYRKITSESKNALDFILVCDLGRLITQNPDEHFYIVSKDGDYDNVIKYVTGHYKCSVEKIKSISQNIVQPNNIKSGLPESTGNELNKLVKNDEAKRVQDFVKANIDNLEVIVRIKGEKRRRPFSVTDKIVLVSLFPIFGENLSNDRANEIRILLKECIDNENTILNITIRAKKAVKSDVITLSNKKDIERVFVLAEPTHKLFDDNDYLYINKDTPKAESERAFNFFFVTELLKAIRLIIPNESECATTDEKYLLLYTLDFLCLHSFDDNTIHLNKDEELYYRNRLEYYNKLLIDYEGYEANTMGSYFYGHDIKVD